MSPITSNSPPSVTEVSWQVTVCRGSRGLGLSVESAAGWPGQVQVKSVFPHQPAALTGRIRPGDVLISVNEMPLRGLSVQVSTTEQMGLEGLRGLSVQVGTAEQMGLEGSDTAQSRWAQQSRWIWRGSDTPQRPLRALQQSRWVWRGSDTPSETSPCRWAQQISWV